MLHHTLNFLSQEMNAYLNVRNNDGIDKVVTSNVADESGNWAIPNERLGLSIINVEEERVYKEQRTSHVDMDGITSTRNPELRLNLYLLVTSNFSGQNGFDETMYQEGLKQLSYVISFFQEKSVFTQGNSPLMAAIDENMEKLIVELFSFSFDQLNNFWSAIGAKYLPSVLYKVRMLRFQENSIGSINPALTGIVINKATR
ncbi:MAG: DUF4255 domain-containing protein [Cyclobacteriaceae bacterium]